MPWSGTGSWVTGHAGQLTNGSRVTKCHHCQLWLHDRLERWALPCMFCQIARELITTFHRCWRGLEILAKRQGLNPRHAHFCPGPLWGLHKTSAEFGWSAGGKLSQCDGKASVCHNTQILMTTFFKKFMVQHIVPPQLPFWRPCLCLWLY